MRGKRAEKEREREREKGKGKDRDRERERGDRVGTGMGSKRRTMMIPDPPDIRKIVEMAQILYKDTP